jgi:hypothetical protein
MKFETLGDIDNQESIAEFVSSTWGCNFSRMGEYSPFDFYFHKNKLLKALVEIKVRKRKLESFPTVFLNLDKFFTLFFSELSIGIAGLFIVKCDDGIFYVRVGNLPVRDYGYFIKGREDRGGFNDIRPVVEIPIKYFKIVRGK